MERAQGSCGYPTADGSGSGSTGGGLLPSAQGELAWELVLSSFWGCYQPIGFPLILFFLNLKS